jgi:hypothetical protein
MRVLILFSLEHERKSNGYSVLGVLSLRRCKAFHFEIEQVYVQTVCARLEIKVYFCDFHKQVSKTLVYAYVTN